MNDLNDDEKQELLDVIEYSKVQKTLWEIEKLFKDAQLKIISQEIFQIINSFEEITFHHIPREKNKVADSIVNQVLDNEG